MFADDQDEFEESVRDSLFGLNALAWVVAVVIIVAIFYILAGPNQYIGF